MILDRRRHVGRDGEANAHVTTTLAVNCRIDPDHLAPNVKQRPAGISGIDGGVGLNEVLIVGNTHVASTLGAHDTDGNRGIESERIANRDNPFSDAHGRRVTHGQRGQVITVNLDDGDLRFFIRPDTFCLEFSPILKLNHDLVGIAHHMMVGQDISILADDEAGALPLLLETTGLSLAARRQPEKTERIIVREGLPLSVHGHRLLRMDKDHRRRRLFRHRGKGVAGLFKDADIGRKSRGPTHGTQDSHDTGQQGCIQKTIQWGSRSTCHVQSPFSAFRMMVSMRLPYSTYIA